MKSIQISSQIESELLIVGAGIGGLVAAVQAEARGIKATLICKTTLGSGASFFPLKATLGIQVTGGESDYLPFKEDIERVAQGMNNPKIVQAYIENSAQAIELLNRIGFEPWKRNDNRPACFAKYPRPIYLIKNWQQAAENARRIISSQKTVLFENATLLHIVTTQNQVRGAVFSQKVSGEIRYIFCKTNQIILASGGVAGLYKDNLYPQDVIGSTHAIAKRAGANLVNLEFIQFIPSFIEPKYKVLFGEHTLKYVTKVTNAQGEDLFSHLSTEQFTAMMKARSDYAPFSVDFSCVEFDLVMMKYLLDNPNEKGVYLHYSSALYDDQEEFYRVYLDWLDKEVGIHLLRDKVCIAPFAHSCNGGIQIDEYAESCVKGLFAVGEVSSCIEGANRLGGNSVGGSLVFAKRAVERIAKRLKGKPELQKTSETLPLSGGQDEPDFCNLAEIELNGLRNINANPELTPSQLLSKIRLLMAKFANVYRSEQNLSYLANELAKLEVAFDPLAFHQYQGIEIYHALKTAQFVVQAMSERKESLGAHWYSR